MKQRIAEIISGSRRGEDNLLIDYPTAADRVIAYLEQENLLVKDEPEIELVAA